MEWVSLTLFTVLAEAAVGIVLLYAVFGLTTAARQRPEAYVTLGGTVLLTAWATTGAAMLLSLTHLGWPQFAFRALGGLPRSWLSWEVLLTGLFALAALLLWVWVRRRKTVGAPTGNAAGPFPWALVGLSALGLAATYASGMIYTLPSIPANAGGQPPLLFLASTLVLGASLLVLLLTVTPAGKQLAADWLAPAALCAVGTILLTGALTLAYTGAASAGAPEARQQAAALTGSAWYPTRLLAGLLAPGLLLLWTARRPKAAQWVTLLSVPLVVAGELAGRLLFFISTVFTGVNTGF